MTDCYYYDQQGNRCKCYDNEALDELLAENAKLRDRVAKLEELLPENGRWFRAETVEAYVAENAKLRDLVTKAHACKTDEGCCEGCYQDEGCCPIERDMKELGIEVTA